MLAIVLFIFAIVPSTYALSMHLQPGDMRCIGQELDQPDYAVFALSATSKVR